MSDDDTTSVRTEYGLTLPNGLIAWNEFRGHPVQTSQQRWHLLQVLRKTADEIGFSEGDFLSRYGWVSRSVTTVIRDKQSWVIDSSEVCTAPAESDNPIT